MRVAVWALANRLGVVAGTPAELLSAVLAGHRRPGPVELPDCPGAAELARELAPLLPVELVQPPEPSGPPGAGPDRPAGGTGAGPVALGDPVAVCAADPLRVTAGYESGAAGHGGLRRAWLRAGQALVREGAPADRALILLTALPGDAHPEVRAALAALAVGTAWRAAPTEPRGAVALAAHRDLLLAADRSGMADGPGGALATGTRPRALAAAPDGTPLLLDERGRLHSAGGPADRLVRAVAATLERHPGTALATAGPTVLVGDRTGSVHAFGLGGVEQTAAHSGRVTALTAMPGTSGARSVVYSGGADGTVRGWVPGRSARPRPLASRPCPVVALGAGGGLLAVAWGDGLVELRRAGAGSAMDTRTDPDTVDSGAKAADPDTVGTGAKAADAGGADTDAARTLSFRPGVPVRAVAVAGGGTLVIGTDETLIRLRPARSAGD
ncbi:hypothetical protein NX801_07095 [Streptomyces sp. LP05-1]|uniref:Uncharacterized protein n=1 Tax=Streptomyces pyxinae TaxID=2970734 RepID=A0ABT2CDC6_9ACTN|nr:hypothetical protein [Streptomyces sp. LP05-1]MCS0635428.1 hypothetical protein [Streptomyces sp. LP05-1]